MRGKLDLAACLSLRLMSANFARRLPKVTAELSSFYRDLF
jgi:hypothetical protein